MSNLVKSRWDAIQGQNPLLQVWVVVVVEKSSGRSFTGIAGINNSLSIYEISGCS